MTGLVFRFMNTQKQFRLKWKPSFMCLDLNRSAQTKLFQTEMLPGEYTEFTHICVYTYATDFISKDDGRCHLFVVSQQSKRQGLSNMWYKILSPEVFFP